MKNKFCIVIPIYREELDCIDEISLKRLWEVVGEKHYDIYFVRPNTEYFNITKYYDLLPGGEKYIYEEAFDEKYFKSTATYSQLCLSKDFYLRFSEYEYMYIYQLDCYLFKDELEYWCDKGYDYIGGPVLSTDCGWKTYNKETNKYKPLVGNGGFSLRKIQTFINLCDPEGEFRKYYKIDDKIIKSILWEDMYFCNDISHLYYLNIPNWIEASEFSLDLSVDIVYNHFKLNPSPMGVHAWDKNIRWWKDIIPELIGNNKVISFCEEKHKEFFKTYYDENNSTLR